MEDHSSESNTFLIPLAIIVAGGLIAASIFFGDSASNSATAINATNQETKVEVPPVNNEDHIVGSRNAELVIIEYSDTECPFCKVFHTTMKEVLSTYGNRVAWVYRHFPIAQLHSKAAHEAEATECAAELSGNQGFWNYINELFERTKSNDSLDVAELPKIATAVGLNREAFESCLNSGKYKEVIQKSIEKAYDTGARGTPYSVIMTKDGETVDITGAEPIEKVKAKIDALLK